MKLVQVWVVCFVIFFGSAELYQWVQGITLPMPVFVIAGALLAIASNADKFPRKSTLLTSPTSVSSPAPPASPAPAPAPVTASPQRHYPGAQLPKLSPQSWRSISFTIRSPQSTIPQPMSDQTDRRES
ncbi:MAG: hypothetical protein Kow00121_11440 [Elainellaceae cyanobacterium]